MINNNIYDNSWYVYAHIKDVGNIPFYIGIGKKLKYKRAFDKKGRNKLLAKIANKYSCFSSILFGMLSFKEACEIEKNLISNFGRIDLKTGTLSNLTDGGEGGCGVKLSDERIEKIRKANTGRKHKPETILKFNQRKQTEETKLKIKNLKTGLRASDHTKQKMSISSLRKNNPACIKMRKKVIDLSNGNVFDSVIDASKYIGVSHSHLSGMLLGRYNNKTTLSYVKASS